VVRGFASEKGPETFGAIQPHRQGPCDLNIARGNPRTQC